MIIDTKQDFSDRKSKREQDGKLPVRQGYLYMPEADNTSEIINEI
jgi:hypothetical protein